MIWHPKILVVHHTATAPDTTLEALRHAHQRRGFQDIGYHFLIRQDGQILPGRCLTTPGAHTRGYNLVSIGVAWIGDARHEEPSPQALEALDRLWKQLRTPYPSLVPFAHRELNPTYCPGERLTHWVQAQRAAP